MFTSALKSFTSNISSNYSVSSTPATTAGPWRVYDAKKKGSNKEVSVFVFDRKALEPGQSGGFASSRSSGSSGLKRAHDEVVERLKKEASSLARLRHPSILELAEPVEETRSGGLSFATERVTVSLQGLLEDKDSQDNSGSTTARRSRYMVQDTEGGGRTQREVDIDELEIQKGLLQVGKGLEFLHESAGIVHANLTPDAIFINAKGDWKISGLGFATPPDQSSQATSFTPIALSEVLQYDPRLPRSVQLNIDFTSPDFVLDTNISPAADMFSLGMIIIALYNNPHRSPIETGQSISTYKRAFGSASSVPTQTNNFLIRPTIPQAVKSEVLPRLITRRPANRYSAREFQQAQYFDNILVSTIRFLESLPAKTPVEKQQFMRGLPRILDQFPKSVLEKKVIPALLEETKDTELLALILQSVFKALPLVPDGRRVMSDQILPRLRAVFLAAVTSKAGQERDSAREGGLMVVLEHMAAITQSCSGKDFKDDVLPLLYKAIDSSTASLVDKALGTLSLILPVLDFSTIKNELFPAIAGVFARTSSMTIKIRGLEAFSALCGGSSEPAEVPDDFSGMAEQPKKSSTSSSAVLDKYTVQEKVVPLLRGIKTKEPAVMMAALSVFKQVGKVADSEFLALYVLPTLWTFSLGPLLNLEQFQSFMTLIKSLSSKIEQEQTRKLSELSSSNNGLSHRSRANASPANGFNTGALQQNEETDFESLVTGRGQKAKGEEDLWNGGWGGESVSARPTNVRQASSSSEVAAFSWSTPMSGNGSLNHGGRGSLQAPALQPSRTVTPDSTLSSYATLTPSSHASGMMSPPLQPSSSTQSWSSQPAMRTMQAQQHSASSTPSSIDWSRAAAPAANPWSSNGNTGALQPQQSMGFGATSKAQPGASNYSNFSIAPPPAGGGSASGFGGMGGTRSGNQQQQQQQAGFMAQQGQSKTGLDKYESLI